MHIRQGLRKTVITFNRFAVIAEKHRCGAVAAENGEVPKVRSEGAYGLYIRPS